MLNHAKTYAIVYDSLVDALAGLLDGPRARGAFLLRSSLDPPWSLRVQDQAALSLVAVVRGEAWILPDDGAVVRLGPRDVAVVRGPEPYVVADRPETPPQVVIQPGQRCTTIDGAAPMQMSELGIRTWGNSTDGATLLLTGTYENASEVSRRLLQSLPRLVHLRTTEWESPLVGLLAAEIVRDEPGQHAVLDRLLDLLLISVLRAWFARSASDTPGWYRAWTDPVIGRALRLIHHDPARQWTVATLAAAAGVSRATFARRFTDLVGQSPMSYLTEWRISMAADLLLEPGATVGSVARRVGYATPFALSSAFKRIRGVSPRDFRIRATSLTHAGVAESYLPVQR